MPAQVRAMTPRDWAQVVDGFKAANSNRTPGSDAPSRTEVADLVKQYG